MPYFKCAFNFQLQGFVEHIKHICIHMNVFICENICNELKLVERDEERA